MDYRALNEITVKDVYPIPNVDDIFDELHGVHYFSKIGLKSRFHHIRLTLNSVDKSVFRTHIGHYEFKVTPFRLCNALSMF